MPLLPQLTVPGPPFASTSRQERQGLCRAGVKVSEISGSVLGKHSGAAPPAVEFQVGHGRVCAELATARSSSLPSAVPGSDSMQRSSSLSLGPHLADALSRCAHRLQGDLPVGWDPGQLPQAATAPQENATHHAHAAHPPPRDPARPEAWALGTPPPTSLSCWAPRPGERVVTVLILD